MDLPRQLLRSVIVRRAVVADVPALVALLADDPLGRTRESTTDLVPYLRAFAEVDADPAHLLVVAESDREVVGTLQLTVLPGLARGGTRRAQLETVRVHRDHRGAGLGAALVGWAVDEAGRRGCGLVQLTSDTQRTDAHRFYERLGFEPSHTGFKLSLPGLPSAGGWSARRRRLPPDDDQLREGVTILPRRSVSCGDPRASRSARGSFS